MSLQLCHIRGCVTMEFGFVSRGLHCFLRLSSAGLLFVLGAGCCWVYSAFYMQNKHSTPRTRHSRRRQCRCDHNSAATRQSHTTASAHQALKKHATACMQRKRRAEHSPKAYIVHKRGVQCIPKTRRAPRPHGAGRGTGGCSRCQTCITATSEGAKTWRGKCCFYV